MSSGGDMGEECGVEMVGKRERSGVQRMEKCDGEYGEEWAAKMGTRDRNAG